MRTFNDNAGRTWSVAINVDALKRVRSMLGVNLLEVVEGKLLERLAEDPILLVDVLYVVCLPEARAREVTDEEFGRGMAGDAIDHGTTCLLEELVDFFPRPKRQVLAKALGKLTTVRRRAIELAERRLDDPLLDARLERILAGDSPETTPGGSSGSWPDSSASTPDP